MTQGEKVMLFCPQFMCPWVCLSTKAAPVGLLSAAALSVAGQAEEVRLESQSAPPNQCQRSLNPPTASSPM